MKKFIYFIMVFFLCFSHPIQAQLGSEIAKACSEKTQAISTFKMTAAESETWKSKEPLAGGCLSGLDAAHQLPSDVRFDKDPGKEEGKCTWNSYILKADVLMENRALAKKVVCVSADPRDASKSRLILKDCPIHS